jgi:hypothetical protein
MVVLGLGIFRFSTIVGESFFQRISCSDKLVFPLKFCYLFHQLKWSVDSIADLKPKGSGFEYSIYGTLRSRDRFNNGDNIDRKDNIDSGENIEGVDQKYQKHNIKI